MTGDDLTDNEDLTVISYVLWFETVALSPFKEHPDRYGAA